MRKFEVRPTLNASTDAKKQGELIEKDDLVGETMIHSQDVSNLLHFHMRYAVFPDAARHDWTKTENIDMFLDNINMMINGELDSFYDHEWWNIHIKEEKHHALDYTGEEPIYLGDIIHMLCDWVAAGRARNPDGEFKVLDYHKGPEFQEKIAPLLFQAFENTLDWLVENTTVGPGVHNAQEEDENLALDELESEPSKPIDTEELTYAERVDEEIYSVEEPEA